MFTDMLATHKPSHAMLKKNRSANSGGGSQEPNHTEKPTNKGVSVSTLVKRERWDECEYEQEW